MVEAVLFDFDNTIANTDSILEIRETGAYNLLSPETMLKVKVYRPVPDLLKTIREAGAKIGIVTNSGRTYIDAVLTHLGLQDAFDVVVTYTDVKQQGMKPSPKGIQLALTQLGVRPTAKVLYVGDANCDHEAAYKAGITPVMPSWASRKAVSTSPALEMSSSQLIDYLKDPDEYRLFAEQCAELGSAAYQRKGVYFLPLDDSANVVTLKQEMTVLCLGRYFSQKAAVTALLHERHALSQEIRRKDEENPFRIPQHWIDMLAHVIRHSGTFAFNDPQGRFDVITVIPAKQGKDPRLERMLEGVEKAMAQNTDKLTYVPNLFYYVEDAQSQKHLRRDERSHEARRALHLVPDQVPLIAGKRILIIDDVTTTGSTISRARELAQAAGADCVLGLVIAKTVTIMEDERPCPKCGQPMRVKKNRSGIHFWGCTGFGNTADPCTHTEALLKKDCPKCGREMRIRTNSHTKMQFWGCTGWNQTPACNYTVDLEQSEMPS